MSNLGRDIQKEHKISKTLPMSSLSEEALHKIECGLSDEDDYSSVEIRGFRKTLTEKEYSILVMVYLDGETVADIAHKYGISRQAVNQTKLAAIKKIGVCL
jgi:RNA polymerase sigma factor (sigma-70 family)